MERNRRCETRWLVLIVGAMVLSGTATGVQAQTVFGGAGWTTGWDDETNLGKGVLVSGGVAQPLGRHLAVEGEVSWARQLRDSGYLAAEGTPLIGTGTSRVSLPAARVSRAGVRERRPQRLVHSTGHFTTRTILPGPGGFPVEGPSTRRDWSLTQPAFELGGRRRPSSRETGSSFRPGGALDVDDVVESASGSTLEPPLWMIRAGVTIEWRVRPRT